MNGDIIDREKFLQFIIISRDSDLASHLVYMSICDMNFLFIVKMISKPISC